MKFIDDLYELYKDQLVGDEEDAVALVLYALQDHHRDDMLKLIRDMSEDEVYQMLGNYLIEKLKDKMDKEGLGQHQPEPHPDSKNVH
ncbi:DUF6154 family protein [Caldalkalibacillus salinus]|uniref:DUF6154 family protein n=1 Tax=Caldalkalibacillus salinus TaxID=2803787 RepID=UPI0019214E90|nr:DUF6154 family protein [Caldalkalibacillus salinus]